VNFCTMRRRAAFRPKIALDAGRIGVNCAETRN
jgi:hypothetical protein